MLKIKIFYTFVNVNAQIETYSFSFSKFSIAQIFQQKFATKIQNFGMEHRD